MPVETIAMSRGEDRRLYTWAAMAAIFIVFADFARTCFLKTSFGTSAWQQFASWLVG